jgi:hypothetical protein
MVAANGLLAISTLVAIRIPGLLKKLDERYRGPYFIMKRTPQGNYLLKNKMGKQLSTSFPLSKLKVIKNWATFDLTADDEAGNIDSQKIERILNDRVHNGIKQFYIKWQGYTSDYNTWVDGTSITDLKQLDNYRSKWNTNASVVKWHAATTTNYVDSSFVKKCLKNNTISKKFHYDKQKKHGISIKSIFNLIRIFFFTVLLLSIIPSCKAQSNDSNTFFTDSFNYCTTNSASLELDFSQKKFKKIIFKFFSIKIRNFLDFSNEFVFYVQF